MDLPHEIRSPNPKMLSTAWHEDGSEFEALIQRRSERGKVFDRQKKTGDLVQVSKTVSTIWGSSAVVAEKKVSCL